MPTLRVVGLDRLAGRIVLEQDDGTQQSINGDVFNYHLGMVVESPPERPTPEQRVDEYIRRLAAPQQRIAMEPAMPRRSARAGRRSGASITAMQRTYDEMLERAAEGLYAERDRMRDEAASFAGIPRMVADPAVPPGRIYMVGTPSNPPPRQDDNADGITVRIRSWANIISTPRTFSVGIFDVEENADSRLARRIGTFVRGLRDRYSLDDSPF